MLRWVAVLLFFASTTAHAQTALERIEPRLARALAEHQVFLTCSSLDAQNHALVRKGWEDMVAAARLYLIGHYIPLADLAAFDSRTAVSALLRSDQSLKAAIEMCTGDHRDWAQRYARFLWTSEISERPLPN